MKYVKQYQPTVFAAPTPEMYCDEPCVYNSKMLPPKQERYFDRNTRDALLMQRMSRDQNSSLNFSMDSFRSSTSGSTTYPSYQKRASKSRSSPDSRSSSGQSSRRSLNSIDSYDVPTYSRKVFVGGLPTDVPREYVETIFSRYGDVMVDWPREASHFKERKNVPSTLTGYVFLVYDREESIHKLIDSCVRIENHYWLNMESPTVFTKAAQVRPWRLCNINYIPIRMAQIDHRRTVFVGGVPRPATAMELAHLLENAFGPVVYAGVDIDPELRYPKGAARVTFANHESYVRAINGRFVKMEKIESNKREVEIKPYVMDDQLCDECSNENNDEDFAQYFCGHRTCLQYYCKVCWDRIHSARSRQDHRPCVRMGDQTKELSELPHHQRLKEPEVEFDSNFYMRMMGRNHFSPFGV